MSLRQKEPEFDKITDISSELAQTSEDSRISANVQQIISRFQTVQSTAKDIVKKCQEAVDDHKNYTDKYKQCSELLAATTSRYVGTQILVSFDFVQFKLDRIYVFFFILD